ncbi:putative 1-deoxy-D-xylulose-5-phosphate synthase [Eubacterium sp. CAG:786]|nr:putative 1-deoxy-D-xylulose-5-phosphate synthase [Eubacterium sp. CAG:786]
MYLENINSPADVKKLSSDEMRALAGEMRTALIKKLSIHGGHCGPNLGMAEAVIALHYVFNSPVDKFVFDVSHQSYCHKMLTGRKDAFLDEAKYDDVTGYSSQHESPHDHFTIGHTSTSVSLACGLAKGRDLCGGKENIIAVIGDGSLSGGEALEGLDFAHELGSNLIIVVNDNGMSIAENHGGLYENLKLLRDTDGKAECNLFRAMGLDYVFVGDGNDIDQLIPAFSSVKDCTKPVVVHIVTEKGRGYAPAVKDKESWHWHMPFDIETGELKFRGGGEDYGELTAKYLMEKMDKDPSVCAITSGTPTVMGFTKNRREKYKGQFIDVGIAEEHAVAMASGIAANGGKPVYGVYSSFIQRTYDQLQQDLCINNNPVTILTFAASVWGMNDVTHLGIFDIPMMSNIPNLVYLAPTTYEEYISMLDWSLEQREHPVAIRVPGGVVHYNKPKKDYGDLNKYEVYQQGSDVAIIALGTFFGIGMQAAEVIEKRTGVKPTLINPIYITGIDEELLESLKATHKAVITLEDGILDGGFGEKIARFYGNSDMKVANLGLKKEFLDRYNPDDVLRENGLTPELIAEKAEQLTK